MWPRNVPFTQMLLLSSLLILSACIPVAVTEEAPIANMPNPAAVYCAEQGGVNVNRTDEQGGQYGVCVFPDGSECDQWAYFRGECQPGEPGSAPSPVPLPGYINETYGFSLDPSQAWVVADYGDYLLFTRPGYAFFLGYQWAEEAPKPFRTGMPQGELFEAGTYELLGQEIPKRVLSWQGKTKVVDYGGRLQVGDLVLVMFLDAVESAGLSYTDLDIPPEIMSEAEALIATFRFTSGETPQIKRSP
jgi:putative hemolysin